MNDIELIDAVATLWVENGGDDIGIDWCFKDIKEAILNKIDEKENRVDKIEKETH